MKPRSTFLVVLSGAFFLCAPLPARAGLVDDYLANPKGIHHKSWEKDNEPFQRIPEMRKQLIEGPTDEDRGVAVANLAFAAGDLAKVPAGHAIARELMDKEVFPNLQHCLKVETTSICYWPDVVIWCLDNYEMIKDEAGQEKCLLMLQKDSPRRDDREMAVNLLAHFYADQGGYVKAINTFNKLHAGSKWAIERPETIALWRKQMARAPIKDKQPKQK